MRVRELIRALFGRRWWWVTLVVLALMAVLARLGIWQLDRLAQRREANAQLLAAIESAPIDLNARYAEFSQLVPDDVGSDLANRDVIVSGSYDYAAQRILKLQSWQGQAGVHLITPFVLDGTNVAVLVDRGWIPDREYEAGHTFADEPGARTIDGYVALTETISRRTADSVVPVSPGVELFRVDVAALDEELPLELLPFYIRLTPAEGVQTELPFAAAKEVDLSEGPHLGYAMQWFIFSLGLGIAYVVFVNRSLTAPVDSAAEKRTSG